jgi:hypothetical protein
MPQNWCKLQKTLQFNLKNDLNNKFLSMDTIFSKILFTNLKMLEFYNYTWIKKIMLDDGKDNKNGPNKLERYINLAEKALPVTNIVP